MAPFVCVVKYRTELLDKDRLPPIVAEGVSIPPLNDDVIDPDPFGIGFAILAIIFGGGAYLEARRQREFHEAAAKEEFRRAWFDSRRSVLHARRVIEEYASYVAEDRFGTVQFLFGKVKLTIDRGRAQQLLRIHRNAHSTANYLTVNLDRLAEGLGSEYQELVDKIHDDLREVTELPKRYGDVIRLARRALDSYETLIDEVGVREQFEESG